MRINNRLLWILPVLLSMQCTDHRAIPKPKALLRMEYPEPDYRSYRGMDNCGYHFLTNSIARVRTAGSCDLEISYPGLKGTIFLTYKPIQGNLETLLKDAQKLSYEHMSKADQIIEQPFVNPEDRVFGMYYELSGDAASQAQFYVTDSTRHFLLGSLYFRSRPNYDSILPAAHYLRRDMRALMESMEWIK